MEKQSIASLSFISTLVITVCTAFSINAARTALTTLSEKRFLEYMLLLLKGTIETVLPHLVYALISITLIKLINTVLCNNFINNVLFCADLLVFAVCVIIFILNTSFLTWIAVCASILNFIFDFVLPHAQM